MAEIEVPEKSLKTRDGKNFTGRARATVTYMDSRNITDIESAPGDFTTLDSNGQEQRLRSYGMFKVGFVDEKNKPLDLVKNMTVKFDPEEVGLSPRGVPPNLWWLDEETGRWVDSGKLKPVIDKTRRSKRSYGPKAFFIGNVATDKLRWINFDDPQRTCYLKVKVSVDPSQMDDVRIPSADIKWIGQESNNFYGYENGVTDANGVACLRSWCDNNGYLQAKAVGRALTPDAAQLKKLPNAVKAEIIPGDTIASIKMRATSNLATNGPVFEAEDLAKCRDKSSLFFGFHAGTDKKLKGIFKSQASWSVPPPSERRCYAKIVATVPTTNYWEDQSNLLMSVMVESFSSNGTERYGFITRRMESVGEGSSKVKIACAEYFCSDSSPTLLRVSFFNKKEILYKYKPSIINFGIKENS